VIRELAPGKVNLVLRVGPVAGNGLHELCSLFASLELADVVEVRESDRDSVVCEGVSGVNLAQRAIDAFRAAHELPPLEVTIDKRIPIAGGMAGGSADAAAVLRAANVLAGEPFDADRLRAIAAPLGSDVPSQVEPGHAIVAGTGERVERVELPPLAIVLVPSETGLATSEVFERADALGVPRASLDCGDLRSLAGAAAGAVAAAMENDLERAAISLRAELTQRLRELRGAGALGAQVSGSGPTVFGVFEDRAAAERAAVTIPEAVVTMVASS
jgi:4-diphosphocytidyl-2-C-methyl-D-erythritol kinase